jgi:DNA-binding beta-propeller fold protein YncE
VHVPKLGLIVAAILLLAAPPAFADGGGMASRGCLVNETGGGCTGVGAGSNAQKSAISPDGRHVYVRAYDTLSIYSRAANGALTFVGCYRALMSPFGTACTDSRPELEQHGGVAVSPDGALVYASGNGGGLVVYVRNETTGALTFGGCFNDAGGGGCGLASGTFGAFSIATIGNNVYVAGQGNGGATTNGAVATFRRNPDGSHAFIGCIRDAGAGTPSCSEAPGLGQATSVAASPDGARVYVAANSGRLTVFNRDSGTGVLTFNKCFRQGGMGEGCGDGATGIGNAHGVAVSPDSANVYVASSFGKGIATFNNSGGTLTQAGCISQGGIGGCASESGLSNMESVVVSPDGNDVYAAGNDIGFGSANPGTLVAFTRAADGALTKRGCLAVDGADGCGAAPGLNGAVGVSADNRNVFVAASASGAGSDPGGVAAFLARQAVPQCEDMTASVPFEGSVPIPLACTDANGDPITLAIGAPPNRGTLGAISGDGTVVYTGSAGATGGDSFTYSAADPDGEGPAATVQITIAAPPPAAVVCRVPRLKGKKLKKARKLLKRANCRLGAVKKPRGVKGKRATARLVVKKQSPRAGRVRPDGTRVKVTLGRKKRR